MKNWLKTYWLISSTLSVAYYILFMMNFNIIPILIFAGILYYALNLIQESFLQVTMNQIQMEVNQENIRLLNKKQYDLKTNIMDDINSLDEYTTWDFRKNLFTYLDTLDNLIDVQTFKSTITDRLVDLFKKYKNNPTNKEEVDTVVNRINEYCTDRNLKLTHEKTQELKLEIDFVNNLLTVNGIKK